MKRFLLACSFALSVLSFCLAVNIWPCPLPSSPIQDISDSLAKEQEEDDSVYHALYPPVVHCIEDYDNGSSDEKPADSIRPILSHLQSNSSSALTVTVDTTKIVGTIPIQSSVSTTGAKIYEIPIDIAPGMNGFVPSISLLYNSQAGATEVGYGWSVKGLSSIVRTSQNVYYDGRSRGISMSKDDAFVLDGLRLIRTGQTDDALIYETEQGFIKAKAHVRDSIISHFEVFYPDGTKGVFGCDTIRHNLPEYPIMVKSDLHGNTISFEYQQRPEHFTIAKIRYNGCSVSFSYKNAASVVFWYYRGGRRITDNQLLSTIRINHGYTTLGVYTLTHKEKDHRAELTSVGYTANNQDVNPLYFSYGTGVDRDEYAHNETKLHEWFKAQNPYQIKVIKGKLDYYTDADGLIMYEYKNPFWLAVPRHPYHFENKYAGNERILIYPSLRGQLVMPLDTLYTGIGFIDLLTADIDGTLEDKIIRVNETVTDSVSYLSFHVYSASYGKTLKHLFSKSFPLGLLTKDSTYTTPYYNFTGDFNGDGKEEILSVQGFYNNRFGSGRIGLGLGSCKIFNLEEKKEIYSGSPFHYQLDFQSKNQTDARVISNNSDKLFVIDCDGDGKSEVCLINNTGLHVYAFEPDTSGKLAAKEISVRANLTLQNLQNREYLLGDFNADGLIDIMLSPSYKNSGSKYWDIYYSKGDGTFDGIAFLATANRCTNLSENGYITQDINNDGRTDILFYNTKGFDTYPVNSVGFFGTTSIHTGMSNAMLIPATANSNNRYSQLLCLSGGSVQKLSFKKDARKEALLTSATSSFGVSEVTNYQFLNEVTNGHVVYSSTQDFHYPFVHIREPLSVVASTSTLLNGSETDHRSYEYENAVLHLQGLGFRGFEKFYQYDRQDRCITQTFAPTRYGVLTKESSPSTRKENTWSVVVLPDKRVRATLIQETEYDKLRETSVRTNSTYNEFGNILESTQTYADGSAVRTNRTYWADTLLHDGYNLGCLASEQITYLAGGKSLSERTVFNTHLRLPVIITHYNGLNISGKEQYKYDRFGNVIQKQTYPFRSDTPLVTSYHYDSFGRLDTLTDYLGLKESYVYGTNGKLLRKTDRRGGQTEYKYDALGREISVIRPDSTTVTSSFKWNIEGTSLYKKIIAETGQANTQILYDALNREIKTGKQILGGKYAWLEKRYDSYGRLRQASYPFLQTSDTLWRVINYDEYDRPISTQEPTGKLTTYSYDKSSVTTIENGVTTTMHYDAQKRLNSITDESGTTNYRYTLDGKPDSIIAPNHAVTRFKYDLYRRQSMLIDPSADTIQYHYNSAGRLIIVSYPNGHVLYSYDKFGRQIRQRAGRQITRFEYNELNDLIRITAPQSTTTYAYDPCGRLAQATQVIDSLSCTHQYGYQHGQIATLTTHTPRGDSIREDYCYNEGFLSGIKVNGSPVYELTSVDAFGNPLQESIGLVSKQWKYNSFGFPTQTSATCFKQNLFKFSYHFNPQTGNLTERSDAFKQKIETFSYDCQQRLTAFGNYPVTYDALGNITLKGDVGTYHYDLPGNPYAVSSITLSDTSLFVHTQNIVYTPFNRPDSIWENGVLASFVYNNDFERQKMQVSEQGNNLLTRYYFGDSYELDITPNGVNDRLYIGGNCYNAPVVWSRRGLKKGQTYGICRDYLGSITHVVATDMSSSYEQSYDAWGRLRNPKTQKTYTPGKEPELFLGRGYTGHEYLPWFGLINMNARLYDPVLARFLSPDPYIPDPLSSQSLNRYSYCLNNPLCYVDQNGKIPFFIVGAIIGGGINLFLKVQSGQIHNVWDGLAAFGIGAVAGAIGSFTGMYGFVALGGGLAGTGGFIAGAASGAIGSACSTPVLSLGNNMFFGDPFITGEELLSNIGFSAISGGLMNGAAAAYNGKSFFTGDAGWKTHAEFAMAETENSVSASNYERYDEQPHYYDESVKNSFPKKKPLQNHHFATNKNKTYTPQMKEITDKYGLDLDGSWNKRLLLHQGRHPNVYHEWVLKKMKIIDAKANLSQKVFVDFFQSDIIEPVVKNPQRLYKQWYKQKNY